jgi:putative aminopeptidase FrvX
LLDLKEHLKSLVETHGPSGHEGAVREVVRAAWQDLTDSMEQDGLGSLIGIKHATRPVDPPRKIMLAAHMDEIGMMVRDIVGGFLFVSRVAGLDPRIMLAQPVMVYGKRPVPGIVATTPPHLLSAEARKKYPDYDELMIDTGLSPDEVNELIQIGDLVTPDVPLLELQGKTFAAKALDDRACVAAVTICLDTLKGMHHAWDVYAAATVQEETGLMGAQTAAYKIAPDIAIALDVTFASQPGVTEDESCELGGGPALGIGANFHPKLVEKLQETAKYHEIKLQDDYIPGASGTDAWAIQVAREGVPTALLSVPIRNMHSPVETADFRDIERAGRLLAHFIAGLDANFLTAIEWDSAEENDKETTSA